MFKRSKKSSQENIREQFLDIQEKLLGNTDEKVSKSGHASQTKGSDQKENDISKTKPVLTKEYNDSFHLSPYDTKNAIIAPETKGNDMKFVVGLSENLLGECRRLSFENHSLKSQIKKITKDLEDYRNLAAAAQNSRDAQRDEENNLKDQNWELESRIHILEGELDKTNNLKSKFNVDNEKLLSKLEEIEEENQELKLQTKSLSEASTAQNISLTKKLEELNNRIEELNDENDHLQVLLSKEDHDVKQGLIRPLHAEGDSNQFEMINSKKYDVSEDKDNKGSTYGSMEIERLEKSLSDSNQRIMWLEGILAKKTQLETKNTDQPNVSSPIRESKKQLERNNSSVLESYSKRTSKVMVLGDSEELSDGETEGVWDDYIDSAEKGLGQVVKPKIPNAHTNLKKVSTDSKEIVRPDADSLDLGHNLQTNAKALDLDDSAIDAYTISKGLKIISQEEYDSLLSKVNFNEIHMKKIAEENGFIIISKSQYTKLTAFEDLKQKLDDKEIFAVSKEEFVEFGKLRSVCERPSKEFLKKKSLELGFALVNKESLDVMNELSKNYEHPSSEYLKSKCLQRNLEIVSYEELDRLRKLEASFEKPSKRYLTEKANDIGFMLTTTHMFDRLSNIANKPSLEFLKEKASDLGFIVLTQEDYTSILNPDIDTLKERAVMLGFSLIETNDLKLLYETSESPTREFIEKAANKLGLELCQKGELHKLEYKLNNPSLQYIETKAESLGCEVVDKAAYETLKNISESPLIEHLEEKAAKLGVVAIPMSDFDALSKPSFDKLSEFASSSGHSLIPQSEHMELRTMLQEPDVNWLKSKAKGLKYDLILSEDLLTMQETIKDLRMEVECPSIKHLETKASELGFTFIPIKVSEDLKRRADNPSISELEHKATALGMKVITNDELESLRTIEDISLEDAKTISSRLGYVMVTSDEINNWKHPSLKVLKEELEKQDYIAIIRNPSEDILRPLAANCGYMLIENNEYCSLKEINEKPLEEIAHIMAEKNCKVLIDNAEYQELKMRTLKDRDLNGENDVISLSKDEYEKLQRFYHHPTKEDLDALAAKLGMSLIQTSEEKRLRITLENPSFKFLESKARDKERALIELKKYEFIMSITRKMNPNVWENSEHEEYRLITENEYLTMKNSLETPSKEYIESRASKLKLILVPEEEYREQIARIETPLPEYIKNKASDLNLVVLTKEEYDEQRETIVSPSPAYIKSKASELNLVVLQSNDYEEQRKKWESPSTADIKTKASKLNLVVVSKEDYEEQIAKLDSPSAEYIQTKASALNLAILPKEEYEEQVARIESPAIEYIEAKASELDLAVLPKREYEEQREKLESPSIADIRDKASKLNLVVLSNEDYKEQITKMESPSREYIETKASDLNLVVLAKEGYEEQMAKIESPAIEYIEAKASELDLAVLPKREYEEQREKLESPSIADIRDKASKLNLVVLSDEDYEEQITKLESPSREYIETKASELNLVVLANEEYEEKIEKSKSSSTDYIKAEASKFNLVVLSKDKYERQIARLESPTVEYIEAEASKLNLITLLRERYNELESKVENLSFFGLEDRNKDLDHHHMNKKNSDENISAESIISLDALQRKAGEMGYRLTSFEKSSKVSNDEINPKLSAIEEFLISRTEATVPLSKYEAIKKKAIGLENEVCEPTLDYVKKKANALNHKVISGSEFEELSAYAGMSDLDVVEKLCNKLGKVALTRDVYDALMSSRNKPTHSDHGSDMSNLPDPSDSNNEGSHYEESTTHRKVSPVKITSHEEGKANRNSTNEKETCKVDLLYEMAKSMGYEILTSDEFNEYKSSSNLLEVAFVLEKAKQLGFNLIKISETQNSEKVADGQNTEDSSSAPHSVESHDQDTRISDIRNSDNHQNESISNPTGEFIKNDQWGLPELKEAAHSLSCIVLPEKDLIKLKQTLADKDSEILGLREGNEYVKEETLKRLAAEYNFVLLKRDEYLNLKLAQTNLGESDSKELQSRAGEAELSSIQEQDNDKTKGASTENFSEDKLRELVHRAGLLCIPKSSFIATTVSRKPDENNAVVLPATYYKKLSRGDSLNIEKVSDPVFMKYAAKKGFEIHRINSENKGTLDFSSPNVPKNDDLETRPIRHVKSDSIPHSLTSNALSMATNVSFTDNSMIPAITQVVIGEYLFKYYRRLMPLSSLSTSRHERYFWVHPYSLTLYWCTSSPVMTNPSELKTKAIAIVSVESIEDNNPLPPGLYHKSIIVHSQQKSVKFTCTTRQRHNIWYNALRYLINRNMEDLTFDMDSFDNNYSNKKKDAFKDMGERNSMPRQRASSSQMHMLKSPSLRKLNRLH